MHVRRLRFSFPFSIMKLLFLCLCVILSFGTAHAVICTDEELEEFYAALERPEIQARNCKDFGTRYDCHDFWSLLQDLPSRDCTIQLENNQQVSLADIVQQFQGSPNAASMTSPLSWKLLASCFLILVGAMN